MRDPQITAAERYTLSVLRQQGLTASARDRRSHSRRNRRFGPEVWALVRARLADLWSPEQSAGRRQRERRLSISHETIYRYIWRDRFKGGTRYPHLRGARKPRRKRYGSYDNRV